MSGLNGRQTAVSVQPAVGVSGDFCDLNPRYTLDAGAGALVAGPNGVRVGRFAWITEFVRMLRAEVPAKGALGLWDWKGSL